MSKYDQLKAKIQQANPEIMELKFGCEFRVVDNPYTHRVLEYMSPGMVVAWYPTGETEQFLWGQFRKDEANGIINVLGRPIRLADTVHWFTTINQATLSKLYEEEIRVSKALGLLLAQWDYLHDNLDDQSDETKQFLIDLLCQK
ncbi:MAG TPA: hypothetical protein VF679_01040 [Pedobacter sp.]